MNEKELLRSLIAEQFASIVAEQETQEVPTGDEPDGPAPASVDDQIDKLLLQYEKLSLPTESEMLEETIQSYSLRFILEQEEVDVDEEGEEEVEAEAGTEEVEEEEETFDEEMPQLDIGTFALKVARLAEIPEKVLDLKDAIINRAIQYLQTNYDDNVAQEFE